MHSIEQFVFPTKKTLVLVRVAMATLPTGLNLNLNAWE